MISKNSKKNFAIVGAACLLSLIFSCQKNSPPAAPLSALESRGKGVFMSNCIACHNPNPSLDGSIGPAIAGSSLELLQTRVLTRGYPPGYKPKRTSGVMPDFPQLKDDIPAIQAYLATFKK
ncbi:MAG: cytochrome c [Bacteriovorax sp.]|nr:cytochrome c [Bacteriovorax sp.]